MVPLKFVQSSIVVLPPRNSGGPPVKPARAIGLGRYCLKAVSEMTDPQGKKVGEAVGYDTDMAILEKTYKVCQRQTWGKRDRTCGASQLFFIPPRDNLECSGQIAFKYDPPVA